MQPSQRRDVLASEAVAPVPNIGRKTAAWARKQGLVARGGKWPPATAESFVVIHRFNPTARAQALSDAELLDVLAEIFAKECARGRGCLRALVRGWAAAHFREEA